MDTNSLRQLILLAESDLQKFAARYSGFEKNDQKIQESQQIICGAKKLLAELEGSTEDLGAD
jgi:hypothetical protein